MFYPIGEGKSTTTTTKRTTTTRAPLTTEAEVETEHVQKTAEIVEGDRCNFKGKVPDKENCASKTIMI